MPLPFLEFPVDIAQEALASRILVNGILLSVFFAKVVGFIFLMFWIRATLPRLRVDRLMNFAWKYMIPLSIVNILIAAVWYNCVLRPGAPIFKPSDYLWSPLASIIPETIGNWLLGWLLTGPVTLLAIWFTIWFNRRIRSTAEEVPTVPHLRPHSTVIATR
jgi:NADH-quinone oxidoreductase subunit H